MRRSFGAVAAAAVTAVALVAAQTPAVAADSVRDQQWYLGFLKLPQAHQLSQGEGVTVAVIDSGIEAQHPDLAGNVLTGADTISGGSGNGWGDLNGHGTAMAGLIAAHGHGSGSGDGVLGVAPKAKILPIRMDSSAGTGTQLEAAQGFDIAIQRGAKIISISRAGGDSSLLEAAKRAQAAGVLVITSIGNKPDDNFPNPMAGYPGVIGVGAVGQDGTVSDVSLRGDRVVLTAPGVGITSTGRLSSNGGYRTGSGTSDSTAIVAGVAALIWAKYPQLTRDQVVEVLTSTATDKGAPGRDQDYGFGIVDPVKALTQGLPTGSAAATTPAPTGGVTTPGASTSDGRPSAGWLIGIGLAVLIALGAVVLVARRRRN